MVMRVPSNFWLRGRTDTDPIRPADDCTYVEQGKSDAPSSQPDYAASRFATRLEQRTHNADPEYSQVFPCLIRLDSQHASHSLRKPEPLQNHYIGPRSGASNLPPPYTRKETAPCEIIDGHR